MLTFEFNGVSGEMTVSGVLTSGMVGQEVQIGLSGEWDGLTKRAVFAAGEVCRAVELTGTTAIIPWEVLVSPFRKLMVGVCGTNEAGDLVIPTIMAEGPMIQLGADPNADTAADPMVPLDALTVDGAAVGLYVAVDDEGNKTCSITLEAPAGEGAERALVDEETVLTLRCPIENFGDAAPSDVRAGKTFSSSAGVMMKGTHVCPSLAMGTVGSAVIDTGLSDIITLSLYRDSSEIPGLVQMFYDGSNFHGVCHTGAPLVGALGTIDGGVLTWRGADDAALAQGEVYHYMAWGEA